MDAPLAFMLGVVVGEALAFLGFVIGLSWVSDDEEPEPTELDSGAR